MQTLPPHLGHLCLLRSRSRNFATPIRSISARFWIGLILYRLIYRLFKLTSRRHGKSAHSKQSRILPLPKSSQCPFRYAHRFSRGRQPVQCSILPRSFGMPFASAKYAWHKPQLIPQGAISSSFNIRPIRPNAETPQADPHTPLGDTNWQNGTDTEDATKAQRLLFFLGESPRPQRLCGEMLNTDAPLRAGASATGLFPNARQFLVNLC